MVEPKELLVAVHFVDLTYTEAYKVVDESGKVVQYFDTRKEATAYVDGYRDGYLTGHSVGIRKVSGLGGKE